MYCLTRRKMKFGDIKIGDRLLINVDDFNTGKLRHQRILEEATGFTYNFAGGLIWE